MVEIVRYTAVDDAGQPINPLILHGQVHGGIGQGVGQALVEMHGYDDSGQVLTASFMDYAMPRADLLPLFDVHIVEDPTKGNPLRIKGGGEGGTTPAPAAVLNAVCDALASAGVQRFDAPATPSRIWAAWRPSAQLRPCLRSPRDLTNRPRSSVQRYPKGRNMLRSTDRILTTHVGSLIRPQSVVDYLRAKQSGAQVDETAYQAKLAEEVKEVIRQQKEVGVDIPSDGEFGKGISWSQYVIERMTGFERRPFKGENSWRRGADRTKFSAFYDEMDAKEGMATTMDSVCVGPIEYSGFEAVQRDIANMKNALAANGVSEGFLPVASPSSVIPIAATNTTRAKTTSCTPSPRR